MNVAEKIKHDPELANELADFFIPVAANPPYRKRYCLLRPGWRLSHKRAAKNLGNTPAVTRQHYVHPAVISAFQKGVLQSTSQRFSEDQQLDLQWLERGEQVLIQI